MTITPYLLFTLSTLVVLGGWTLAVAIHQAEDGYEDASGFNLGILPALPISMLRPQAATAPARSAVKVPTAAPSHFSTGTTTHSVNIFVSSGGRAASPLYRRYRRSGNSASPFFSQSASPFPTPSASPFPVQSASPFPTQSASPFPVQSASPFSAGSASPFPPGSASPFAMQCASVRARGGSNDSNPPIPPSGSFSAGDRPTT
jgi:hypothetical protein